MIFKNDFYQRNPFKSSKQQSGDGDTAAMSTTISSHAIDSSSLQQLLDYDKNTPEFDSFEQLLKSSSSIETLLTEDEIKRWRIGLDALDMGDLVGRGAFGVSYSISNASKSLKTNSNPPSTLDR